MANDTVPNSVTIQWNKTGTTGIYRRYIQLNCTKTNISYTPYYFYTPSDMIAGNKKDVLHHDQGTNGTIYDTGYLLNYTLTDTMHIRNCSLYAGYWFDESICIEPLTLDNIYYHIWWSDTDDHLRLRWKKTRQDASSTDMLNQFDVYGASAMSNITYNNGIGASSNNYHLIGLD